MMTVEDFMDVYDDAYVVIEDLTNDILYVDYGLSDEYVEEAKDFYPWKDVVVMNKEDDFEGVLEYRVSNIYASFDNNMSVFTVSCVGYEKP